MNYIKLFKKNEKPLAPVVQTGRPSPQTLFGASSLTPLAESKLYKSLRESVPIIDAAIQKILRLVGGFTLECGDKQSQQLLNRFVGEVQCGAASSGLESFVCTYLDSLLTYGTAIGEMVFDKKGRQIVGLYNASLDDVLLEQGKTSMQAVVKVRSNSFEYVPIKHQDRVLYTALNPDEGELYGNSLLKGLPFVASILTKIFEATSNNFERIGNLRYAINYKPTSDGSDKAYAKERAMQIAREWSDGMMATRNGHITDFVSVGDVSVKVIGADNQWIDTSTSVRQLLEQIVAKLGLPPFLLGLNWSTTERMSRQQADILTSELEYYRRLLSPVILRICKTLLGQNGLCQDVTINWSVINLQDETEHSRAELYYAQAERLRMEAISKEEETF